MGWLDKLKSLINIEFHQPLISVNIVKDSHNEGGSRNHEVSSEGVLSLNIDRLTPEQRAGLRSVLGSYADEGNLLLGEKPAEVFTDIKQIEELEAVKNGRKLLLFFEGIIPKRDLEVLEAAVILRAQYLAGKDIKQHKYDLRNRFGARGSNIVNLFTAGYFEEYLQPLYNSSPERFEELYGLMVDKAAVVLFVHGQMTVPQIREEIEGRIRLARRYGHSFIHVHGRGQRNIKAIQKTLSDLKDLNITEKNIHRDDAYGGIIWVEILL